MPPAPEEPADAEEIRVASDDVKALVAPIALDPDPLLELVLQASAQPGQVVLAARFLEEREWDPSRQPDEDWDTAIVGLLSTPDVLAMMNESLDWTTELGQAVAEGLEEVQIAVQELRWSAYNMGALKSNEWQEVVATGGVIAIVPAQREQVSVPQYDGAALLESSSLPASASSFAPSEPAGGAAPVAPAPAAGGPAESYGYAAAPVAVPVTYAAPQPSFWSTAAVFAGDAWRFDTAEGLEEIQDRRIGRHELAAIELMREYVEAQMEYASEDRDGDEVLEYAQRLLSESGTRNGLYWPDDASAGPSPLDEFVARADAEGYRQQQRLGDPYRGYYFRVLTRQGPTPPGGAYDYVINGNMIAGFALLGWPAEYGNSGVKAFLVNQQGRVYEKDLGADTERLAGAIEAYDPAEGWSEVDEAE